MNILLLLVPLSLALLGVAVAALCWAVRAGQFEDLDTPALDILVEDATPAHPRPAQVMSTHAMPEPGDAG